MSDFNYSESMQRLELILAQLEEGKLSIDELSKLVKEAAELVKVCRAKLKNTEEEIQKAFEGA